MRDPFPLDHIGPALRELDAAVTALARISETEPLRLQGDAAIITGSIQGLRLVLNRIEALQGRQAAE
jgi:hypothetical protein